MDNLSPEYMFGPCCSVIVRPIRGHRGPSGLQTGACDGIGLDDRADQRLT